MLSARSSASFVLASLVAAISSGCATATSETGDPVGPTEIQALLDAQRDAWNRGDLEAFMAGYLRTPELSFVGSGGLTRGFDETLARYRRSYPDDASRGRLDFELVEVRPLGAGAAVAIGRWRLAREAPVAGWFTLVLQRRAEGLRIVHDHSS